MKFEQEKNSCLQFGAEDLRIRIYKFGRENVLSAFSHAHSEYEFLLPITPLPHLSLNGALHYGECGKIYSIPSFVEHGIAAELSEVSYISILISKEFFEGMMAKTGYNMCGFLLEFDLSHKLNNLMHLFKDEFTSNPANGECMRNISALIAAELLIAGSGARNQARSEYHYIKTVKETADYINNNVSQDVSIDELASLCNMSRYHYIRTFKKCFGVPPYKYLIKARLSIAKLLLESTNLSMTEISLKSGFLTPNRFSEVFKQNMNMTPTEYRRLFNKNYRPTIK